MSESGGDPQARVESGDIIAGRYRLKEVVGRGGMGTVFRAVQTSVERDVAVKVMHSQARTDQRLVARFQREARAVAALSHPNTIRLIDFGQTAEGALYLVTEYLKGQSLGQVAKCHGPLEPMRVIRIAMQICESLAEAHASGIVHRDIKPDNLFLASMYGKADFIKVLDFGIAKLDQAMTPGSEQLTSAGVCIGSPRYISPEQALGEQVTAQADVYSLGVVLYELLAGRPLFQCDVPQAYLLAHIQEEPRALKPDLDPRFHALAQCVMQCLEKHPLHRPRGANSLIEALEILLQQVRGVSEPSIEPLTQPSPGVAQTIDASSVHTLDLVDTGRSRVSQVIAAAAEASLPSDLSQQSVGGKPEAAHIRPADVSTWRVPVFVFAASALISAGVLWWMGQSSLSPDTQLTSSLKVPDEVVEGRSTVPEGLVTPASSKAPVALAGASAEHEGFFERPVVHQLQILTTPAAATVASGNVELCRTPCTLSWDGDPVYPVLSVSRPGFQTATFRLDRHIGVEQLHLALIAGD